MSTEHTRGPWFASDEDGEVYSLSDYSSVAIVLMNEEGKANARLIAAAPDLLAALKMCVIERSEWLDEARAAIAKAEGRSS